MNLNFDKIYKENFNKLFRTAYRIVGNIEDTSDVLQESFLNAYKNFDNFKWESSVSTWLYKIVVNCSLKYIKKRKSFPVTDIAKENGVTEEQFFNNLKSLDCVENNVLERNIKEMCLQLFVNCMPKQQRITFVLKTLMKLSVKEVAVIMDISPNAVKTNIHRVKMLTIKNMSDRCSLINPDGLCTCKGWAKRTILNKTEHYVPQYYKNQECSPAMTEEIKLSIKNELNFLYKVSYLYNNDPDYMSSDEFITKMKETIEFKKLNIFK
ncbi:MAG TPA: sigma-70 family RNA polymerase sigma factor [Spirochaetota bacterium]|nr:sigma-70 family RNA polymerase sigma factor [Spirochaetota bacterium]